MRRVPATCSGLVLLAAVGVTVKLSLFGLAAAVALVALGSWLARASRAARWRGVAGALAVAAAAGGPWTLRGALLSGYLAYPSTVGALAVEWRVPREVVDEASRSIRVWSQVPGWWWQAVVNPRWFSTWLVSLEWTRPAVAVPLALGAVSALAALVVRLLSRVSARRVSAWILLPPVASLVFCFVTAPRPRFAAAAPWILAASGMVLAADGARVGTLRGLRLLAIGGALGLGLAGLAGDATALRARKGFDPLLAVRTREVELASGLVVRVPEAGDSCWDAPPPCAPGPDPTLALRRPGDLASGFVVRTVEHGADDGAPR